jgi:hypothetical protein
MSISFRGRFWALCLLFAAVAALVSASGVANANATTGKGGVGVGVDGLSLEELDELLEVLEQPCYVQRSRDLDPAGLTFNC